VNVPWFLRLYPRAWRERYGEEFAALVAERRMSVRDVVDVISGAIDARFAQGVSMSAILKSRCLHSPARLTVAEGLMGAGLLVAGSFVLSTAGIAANRSGFHDAGEFLKGLAFPVSLVIWSHYTYMRNQSRVAKLIITGGTLAILTLAGLIAAKL
jgi:hypothetical protein